MAVYNAPLRDIRFNLQEVLNYDEHCASLSLHEPVNQELVDAVLDEAAKFVEQELVELNAVGDAEGCRWEEGVVTTPTGFKDAYQKFVASGWPSLSADPQYGGQGLPHSLGTIVSEMSGTANWAWAMYPGLSHGAHNTITAHGSEEQKQTYLTKLTTGEWTGTMCLTESHCGTDLGLLQTKAEPNSDGSYSLKGSKIFISAGEHDLAENIVHIVLARLPGAPAGTKGISLFIVPKFLVNDDGSLGDRNTVKCGAIEHKMGIHGNATCVMNFDGAKGFLIGEPNRGLHCMFTFMNVARLGTALQGLAHTEWAFQNSLVYAKDRLQMRSLSGHKNPLGPADPLIVHPDVRRMLLTQKAVAESGRLFIYYLAQFVDTEHYGQSAEAKQIASQRLALLTPIAKAFLTEIGFECANHGMQIYGGHGFISEWGMEQNVRDCRISMLYEGTTGIQALDLLGRKVIQDQSSMLRSFIQEIEQFCVQSTGNKKLIRHSSILQGYCQQWRELTTSLTMKSMANSDNLGAASVDYLMYSGYIVLAYMWLKSESVAHEALADKAQSDVDFYQAKLKTASFYFERLLPRSQGHYAVMQGNSNSLMSLSADHFSF